MDTNASPEKLEDDPGVSTVSDGLSDDLSANVEPWAPLVSHLGEILEYLACYLGIQVERGKLSLKDYIWKIAIGLGALFVGVVTLMVAIGFVLYGMALGLGEVWDDHPWIGFLSVGLFFLLMVTTVIAWQWKRSAKKNLQKRVKDYERTLDDQQRRFGSDLESRAASFAED